MTADELVLWSRTVIEQFNRGEQMQLAGDPDPIQKAKAIVGLLGVGLPCGYDDFLAIDGDVVIPEGSYAFGNLTPEDARGVAAALLRAADAAELHIAELRQLADATTDEPKAGAT